MSFYHLPEGAERIDDFRSQPLHGLKVELVLGNDFQESLPDFLVAFSANERGVFIHRANSIGLLPTLIQWRSYNPIGRRHRL